MTERDTGEGAGDAAGAPVQPRAKGTGKSKGQGGLGPTIGGILVGFDQEIMRRMPPTQELVKRGAPIRRVTGQDGSDLVIGLPEDLAKDEDPAPDP